MWSLQSDAKCLSPCLLRAPLLGKAMADEYLKLSLTEIDCRGHMRCLHKVSPIPFRWPHSRSLKSSSKNCRLTCWSEASSNRKQSCSSSKQPCSYNTLSNMINKSVDVHLFPTESSNKTIQSSVDGQHVWKQSLWKMTLQRAKKHWIALLKLFVNYSLSSFLHLRLDCVRLVKPDQEPGPAVIPWLFLYHHHQVKAFTYPVK